jgi:hypothetical protein
MDDDMELCSEGHEEVCFEGGRFSSCPACEAIEDLNSQIEKLNDEIATHECTCEHDTETKV